MSLIVEWRGSNNRIGEADILFIALPGVGNIGKTCLEALNELNEGIEIARLHHTALPPLATLDDDGLLSPPHFSLKKVISGTGKKIVTISGTSQPLEPQNQGFMAREIMEFIKQESIEISVVLAGMVDEPSRKETFIVPSSAKFRIELEERGANVRRDEPSSGAIGMAALLASLGPVYEVNTACAIATSVGASGDSHAAGRLLSSIDDWFSLGIELPKDTQKNILDKLADIAPNNKQNYVAEMSQSHDGFYL